ncbi:thioredoxin family protein [Pseudomonas sp. nanlin1]|uniref:thioredoxin family protein n=1 Tax=Pseudomonas sp. nanlin1 TaxID=3040605 RepID=UPI0038904CE5
MVSFEQLFEVGESFADFARRGLAHELASVQRVEQQLAEPEAISAATLARLAAITGRYHLLVAGEIWCPDCQLNVTALDFMCRRQGALQLAVISKGRAENHFAAQLGLARVPVPLVLVLDAQFALLGQFVERPRAVVAGDAQVLAEYKAGLYLEAAMDDVLAIIEAAQG